MSFLPASFDFIAPVYDRLAALVYGESQRRAQAHFLGLIFPGARVLVLGGGTGWVLEEILRQSSPACILYLEASAAMLQRARHRLQHHPALATIEFRLGTEQDLLPQETFHVILTPFVLDLFSPEQVAGMLHRLDQALLPGGLWLHTDFQLAPSGAKRLWQKPLEWAMYRFFGLVSGISGKELPPTDYLFRQAGFDCKAQAPFFGGFIQAQVLQKPTSQPQVAFYSAE